MDPEFDPYYYRRLRLGMLPRDPMQAIAGPLAHREFMRELVSDAPAQAIPLAVKIPVYSAGKYATESVRKYPRAWAAIAGAVPAAAPAAVLLNRQFGQARSPASWDEIFAGYEGLFSGLKDRRGK